MATCFLSYSEAYRPVMETLRHLLVTLEFQVDVFDGPDLSRPPLAEFQHRLLTADCVVLLLGPREPAAGRQDLEPAHWPAETGRSLTRCGSVRHSRRARNSATGESSR
ncbi:MAG: hypothetical protein EHM59_04990 [Betaproteobacteria bacterium]|nr:MAG: hypothetical protein EHM59_04990 [Betaproteobacteria bacterium]